MLALFARGIFLVEMPWRRPTIHAATVIIQSHWRRWMALCSSPTLALTFSMTYAWKMSKIPVVFAWGAEHLAVSYIWRPLARLQPSTWLRPNAPICEKYHSNPHPSSQWNCHALITPSDAHFVCQSLRPYGSTISAHILTPRTVQQILIDIKLFLISAMKRLF